MRFLPPFIICALSTGVLATSHLGFNSGNRKDDRSPKFKADFEAEFLTAQNLQGAPGHFNAVRLFTNIQADTEDDPIEAFEAAINTNTSILLGVWASGTDNIENEIKALKKAVDKYGSKLTDRCIGVSIGSEDLYRISVRGIKNKSNVGNSPRAIVGFIQHFREAFKDTLLGNIPVGHVEADDVFPNATNKPVLDAIDWLGVNIYPYYHNESDNSITHATDLFDKYYQDNLAAANGKPIWITETGWPVTGPRWGEAATGVNNTMYYWDHIGCRRLFGKIPTFWYNLRDSNPDNTEKFAISKDLSTTPLFDISCAAVTTPAAGPQGSRP